MKLKRSVSTSDPNALAPEKELVRDAPLNVVSGVWLGPSTVFVSGSSSRNPMDPWWVLNVLG